MQFTFLSLDQKNSFIAEWTPPMEVEELVDFPTEKSHGIHGGSNKNILASRLQVNLLTTRPSDPDPLVCYNF